MRPAVVLLLAIPGALFAKDRIAHIEFFGYKGIDVRAVRQALPFHEGDIARPEILAQAASAVQRVTGRNATDVQLICCTSGGDRFVFIGLPGTSSHPLTLDPAPQGNGAPSRELTKLYEEMRRAEEEAVRKSLPNEDRADGYRLMKEPAARAAEQALRSYVLGHEREILDLTASADATLRANAVDALGFGARSPQQVAALVRATRDPDAQVRNNGTRALMEILPADPSLASEIQPDNFIQMLRSGVWTDRNKAAAILMYLTQSRDPKLLARVKSDAGDALQEMADWHGGINWATVPRVILARVSGDSDYMAYLGGLSLSLWQGTAVAVFISALFAFLFVRLTSKGVVWTLAFITPAAVSALLYWVLLRVSGLRASDYGVLGLAFILTWSLAAMTASCAIVLARLSRSL